MSDVISPEITATNAILFDASLILTIIRKPSGEASNQQPAMAQMMLRTSPLVRLRSDGQGGDSKTTSLGMNRLRDHRLRLV